MQTLGNQSAIPAAVDRPGMNIESPTPAESIFGSGGRAPKPNEIDGILHRRCE
ncbi:MAG: hypothetical protein QHH26_11285 [Armatimonadota bacterium]|nr:hypothetical protein [Armatimonadota bacterium]